MLARIISGTAYILTNSDKRRTSSETLNSGQFGVESIVDNPRSDRGAARQPSDNLIRENSRTFQHTDFPLSLLPAKPHADAAQSGVSQESHSYTIHVSPTGELLF